MTRRSANLKNIVFITKSNELTHLKQASVLTGMKFNLNANFRQRYSPSVAVGPARVTEIIDRKSSFFRLYCRYRCLLRNRLNAADSSDNSRRSKRFSKKKKKKGSNRHSVVGSIFYVISFGLGLG